MAKEFYASAAGRAFAEDYMRRKGRRVNNPLRRKEVGDYFTRVQGYPNEHRLAAAYAAAFNEGVARLSNDADSWRRLLEGMRFLLGLQEGVVTVQASDSPDGSVHVIDSSSDPSYEQFQSLLQPGCSVSHVSRPHSSGIGVVLAHEDRESTGVSLAMWKDGTIQYKLDSRGRR